jgi:hypothetical protein
VLFLVNLDLEEILENKIKLLYGSHIVEWSKCGSSLRVLLLASDNVRILKSIRKPSCDIENLRF